LFESPLLGFFEENVQPMGLISFPVTTRTTSKQATVHFLVVDRPSAYNDIMRCNTPNKTIFLKERFYTKEWLNLGLNKGYPSP
jgi:hypothetical protein